MNPSVGPSFRLVHRGGPGLSCDETGVALGAVPLVERSGSAAWSVCPAEELSGVLATAYGHQTPEVVAKCHRGLHRIARRLEAGDLAQATMEAVMVGFPDLSPPAMAKLALLIDLSKDAAWENEPRVPAGQRTGGQWTTGGSGGATQASASQGDGRPEAPHSDGVYHPNTDRPALTPVAGASDAEGDTREGTGAEPPAQEPTTLDQMFPGLKNNPAIAIIAPIEHFLAVGAEADGANLDIATGQYRQLVREIRAIDPNWRDNVFYLPGGLAGLSWQGRNAVLEYLRVELAVAYYKIRHDPEPLQVETIRFLHKVVDDAYNLAEYKYKSGQLDVRQSPAEAIGNEVDREVRAQLKTFFSSHGINFGADQDVTVNNRVYTGYGNEYRLPDAQVADLAIEWTLQGKTMATAQVRGFLRAQRGTRGAVIIRPSQLGGDSVYLIPHPYGPVRKVSTMWFKNLPLYIPETVGDVDDLIGSMLLGSPKFIDRTGYLPHLNLETTFRQLDEGLQRVKAELGADLFQKLAAMSEQMRPLFEADPDEETGQAREGQKILLEMSDLVEARARELAMSQPPSPSAGPGFPGPRFR
jgi:hypothetical protein